jgi:dipicolinate synthase subunit B
MKIGFALTGSHCTLAEVMEVLRKLVDEGADVTPVISYAVDQMDTRFGKAEHGNAKLKELTAKNA